MIDLYAGLADLPHGELPGIVARAKEAGVDGALVVGGSVERSRRAIQIAERFAVEWGVWAAVGILPAAAGTLNEETLTALHRMGQARRVRAVVAGLDVAPGLPPRRVQEPAFDAMLQLCQWLDLPLLLHAGEASGARLAERVRAGRDLFSAGVLHDFNGTAVELEAFLALGLSLSVSGRVTDRRHGARVRALLPEIPVERLLIETNTPHHPPKPHRLCTHRSEPAFLPDVLKEVAHLRHVPAAPLADAVTANARAIFGLDLP